MSKTRDNSLTRSYQGKFGKDFVLRNREELSIMAKPPRKTKKPPAESQKATRERFRMASKWARRALKDPEKMEIYQQKANGMLTPYIRAVTDYLRPPEVKAIDVTAYTGAIGEVIRVTATDDISVVGVKLTISAPGGDVIESGPCVESSDGESWDYAATVAVPVLTGVVVTAEARDIPNHPGFLEVEL